MKRRTVAVIASWSLLALTAPTAAAEPGDLVTFISPTGNVGCILDADYARCDIIDRDWNPPPRPVDCELDYGQGIGIAPGERPAFVCAGDTTLAARRCSPTATHSPAGNSVATAPRTASPAATRALAMASPSHARFTSCFRADCRSVPSDL